jgi:5'-nucleotidase
VLKVDVPCDATSKTPWVVTRLSRIQYFEPIIPERSSWDIPATMGYTLGGDPTKDAIDSDVYAIRVKRCISVTPLSLDMTSRVDLADIEQILRK